MRKKTFIISVFMVLNSLAFSQGTDKFSFVETGGGGFWSSENVYALFNVAHTSSVSESFAVEFSYHLGADKSSVEFHEIGVKIGPYIKLGNNSYFMLSAGGAIMFDPSGQGFEHRTVSGSSLPVLTYDEGDNLVHMPLQAKLNVTAWNRMGAGMKYTYNKNFKDGLDDRSYFVLFLSYSLSGTNQ